MSVIQASDSMERNVTIFLRIPNISQVDKARSKS